LQAPGGADRDALDAILDQVSVALYGGVVSVLVVRTVNRLQG